MLSWRLHCEFAVNERESLNCFVEKEPYTNVLSGIYLYNKCEDYIVMQPGHFKKRENEFLVIDIIENMFYFTCFHFDR